MQTVKDICRLFSGFTDNEYTKIQSKITTRKFSEAEIILHPKHPNKSIYIVLDGIVKIESGHENKTFTIGYLTEGQFFGHVGTFSNGFSKVQATCITDVTVCQIKQETIEELLLTSPIFMYNLLNIFAKMAEDHYNTIHNLAFHTVRSRVATKLLTLESIFSKYSKKSLKNTILITQQELANFVGTARENISKLLAELKNAKIIELHNKKIIILDKEALEKISQS